MTDRDPTLVKYERLVLIALMLLFAGFVGLSILLGGDALNGRVENGLYYVSAGDTDTAVHPVLFFLSAIMGSVALGGLVLFFVYKLIILLRRKMRSRSNID